jgi:hypothetical protein
MAFTSFFASFLGLLFLIMSWSILLNHMRYHKVVRDMLKHEGIVFCLAFLGLTIGLMMVILHSVWGGFVVTLVSVLGWIIFLKSVFVLLLPELAEHISRWFEKKDWFMISGAVYMVLGLYLTYVGFFL